MVLLHFIQPANMSNPGLNSSPGHPIACKVKPFILREKVSLMSRSHLWLLFALISCLLVNGNSLYGQSRKAVQERADQFLALVNAGYQALYRVESEAQWLAATVVSPVHDAASETAGKARAAFVGHPALIREAQSF